MNKLSVEQLNDLREAAKEHGQDWVDLVDMALQVGDFEILKAENKRLLAELAELKITFRVDKEGDREVDELKSEVKVDKEGDLVVDDPKARARLDKAGDRVVDGKLIRKPYVK